jgi:hypothetical protein
MSMMSVHYMSMHKRDIVLSRMRRRSSSSEGTQLHTRRGLCIPLVVERPG